MGLFSKTLDVVTLFHRPAVQPSVRAFTLLKQLSAQEKSTATEDQASDHAKQPEVRTDWELQVSEDVPTSDQLRTILDYVGETKAGEVVSGASNTKEAISILQGDRGRFKPPVTVDWHNGKAVLGFNESQILKMLQAKNGS